MLRVVQLARMSCGSCRQQIPAAPISRIRPPGTTVRLTSSQHLRLLAIYHSRDAGLLTNHASAAAARRGMYHLFIGYIMVVWMAVSAAVSDTATRPFDSLQLGSGSNAHRERLQLLMSRR